MVKEWYIKKWGVGISVWQNWSELLPWKIKEYNWVNFIPIEINFELGWYKGKYFEFRFILLNLGFEFEIWNRKSREDFVDYLKAKCPEAFEDKEWDDEEA